VSRIASCNDGDHRKKEMHSAEFLCGFSPRVAMVQAPEARHRGYVCGRGRLRLDSPFVRGVLFEGVVNPVLMVIARICPRESEEMAFVQRDHMVQDLTATASNPAFRGSILPG
jgi:hypothetical protein